MTLDFDAEAVSLRQGWERSMDVAQCGGIKLMDSVGTSLTHVIALASIDLPDVCKHVSIFT
jgi:hypothetical protein